MADKAKAKKTKALSKKVSTAAKKQAPAAETESLVLERPATRSPKIKAHSALQQQDTPKKIEPELEAPAPAPEASLQPRVVAAVIPRQEPVRPEPRKEAPRQDPENDGLRVRLSQSLIKKLKDQAADEGISLDEFVGELLAESVVLRAWEIVERKNAMKGPNQGPQNNHRGGNSHNQGGGNRGGGNNNQRGNNNNNNQGNKGHRGMSHMRYQSIMDDKATFLEYVRSQEKNRR